MRNSGRYARLADGELVYVPPKWASDPALAVDAEAVTTMLTTLSQLVAEARMQQAQEPTGLDQPTVTLAHALRDDSSEHLALGVARQGEPGGHYFGRCGIPGMLVVSGKSIRR